MCWLLPFTWDGNVFGAIGARLERGPPPAAPALLLLLLSTSSAAGALCQGRGGSDGDRGGEGKRFSRAAQKVPCWWAPGLFVQEGLSSTAQFSRISFFTFSRVRFWPSFCVCDTICAAGTAMAVAHSVEALFFQGAAEKAGGTCSLRWKLFLPWSITPHAISPLGRSGQAHCAHFVLLQEENTFFFSLWGAFPFRLRPLLWL